MVPAYCGKGASLNLKKYVCSRKAYPYSNCLAHGLYLNEPKL